VHPPGEDRVDLSRIPDSISEFRALRFECSKLDGIRAKPWIQHVLFDLDVRAFSGRSDRYHSARRVEGDIGVGDQEMTSDFLVVGCSPRKQSQPDNDFILLPESLLLLKDREELGVHPLHWLDTAVCFGPGPPLCFDVRLPERSDLWVVGDQSTLDPFLARFIASRNGDFIAKLGHLDR
jgi:hypothetical protein